MKNLFLFITFCFSLFLSSREPVKVKVKEPGTLSALLTQAQQDTCQYLVVSGKLNSADIKVLRKMAGADGRGKLTILNLMNATIVSSETPYLTIRNAEEKILAGKSYEHYEPTSFSLGPLSNHFDNLDFHLEDDRYSPISRGVTTEDANYVLLGEASAEMDVKLKARNLAEWKSLKQQKRRFLLTLALIMRKKDSAPRHLLQRVTTALETAGMEARQHILMEKMIFSI
jgi:hypothetical protein